MRIPDRRRILIVALTGALLASACSGGPPATDVVTPGPAEPSLPATAVVTGQVTAAPGAETIEPAATAPTGTDSPMPATAVQDPLPDGVSRPPWLHTRPLEVGPDGEAVPGPTPEELVVRRIPTVDLLPPPADAQFHATTSDLTTEVLARATWSPECPVDVTDLRYLTLTFWGFDDRPHTGEMIVNAQWARDVVEIFRGLHEVRYPIEEMRVVAAAELEGTPTGDTNNTSAFVCRPIRGSTAWSQHAYGLAVDVNPFINPYRRGDRILPELAGAYLDREHERPGMLNEGSPAVAAFDAIGWGWGGRWTSLIDWMHFSANGR